MTTVTLKNHRFNCAVTNDVSYKCLCMVGSKHKGALVDLCHMQCTVQGRNIASSVAGWDILVTCSRLGLTWDQS
jgi:hypothetical protein